MVGSLYAGGRCTLTVSVLWQSLYASGCCMLVVTLGVTVVWLKRENKSLLKWIWWALLSIHSRAPNSHYQFAVRSTLVPALIVHCTLGVHHCMLLVAVF